MKVEYEKLERGLSGTTATIDKMHKLVALGKLDPTLQKIATWIRLSVPNDARGSSRATADAVFNFVRDHGIFQRDPFQIEKIEHPIEAMRPVIEARQAGTYHGPALFVGDCDTLAGVFLATLGGILGFQYAFETAKVDSGRPDEFSHVWVAFRTGSDWYPLDPSTPGTSPGWRPPVSPDKFKRWPEKQIEEALGMSGMNGMGYDPNGPVVPQGYFNEQPFWGWGDAERLGRPEVPKTDPGDPPRTWIPDDNAKPASDFAGEPLHYLKQTRRPSPRERDTQMESYNYDPQPNYYPQPEYIHLAEDGGASPAYPFARQVEVLPGDPIRVRRRNGEVIMQPQDTTGLSGTDETYLTSRAARRAVGMGTIDPDPGSGGGSTWQGPVAPAPAIAAAGPSIWESISAGIKAVLPAVTAAEQIKLANARANAASALARAQQTVAQQAGVQVPMFVQPKAVAWYANPIVWVGGVLVIGGAAYVMTRR